MDENGIVSNYTSGVDTYYFRGPGEVHYIITSYFNLYALQVHLQYSVDVHISSCIELIVK